MAKKRSSKAGMTAVAMPTQERETVSIRKIENGYLINHCVSGKDGSYKETERFSPKKPDMKIPLKGDKK